MSASAERRRAKVFDGDNDMVIVYAELDRLAGDRFKTALHDFSDRLFREDAKNGSDRTHERRNADALVALVTQQPDAALGRHADSDVHDDGSDCEIAPQATTLIVTVDYDTLSGQLKDAGLVDGTPVDIDDTPPYRLRRWHRPGHLRRRRPSRSTWEESSGPSLRRSEAGL